jgi:hypothetical protein
MSTNFMCPQHLLLIVVVVIHATCFGPHTACNVLSAECQEDQEPSFDSATFSIFGKQSMEDFATAWNKLVKEDGSGLKIKARSHRPIPMFGTLGGNTAMKARLGHSWGKNQEVIDLWDVHDDDPSFAGARRVESHPGNSILLHTSGYYAVKVTCSVYRYTFNMYTS